MEEEIKELQAYLEEIVSFSLPKFKELPGVELYMEQVLKYINGCLATLDPEQERSLTSFMVNNYVKAKMISEPVKKKYSQEQIGYLMAICLLKSTMSMSDMSLLIELDGGVIKTKERLYEFWSHLESSALKLNAAKAINQVNAVSRRYASEKEKGMENADENARNALGLLALRLSIQAQANKILADGIIAELRKEMHGAKSVKLERKHSSAEMKHEERKGVHEAGRLASAKHVESNSRKKASEPKKKKTKEEN